MFEPRLILTNNLFFVYDFILLIGILGLIGLGILILKQTCWSSSINIDRTRTIARHPPYTTINWLGCYHTTSQPTTSFNFIFCLSNIYHFSYCTKLDSISIFFSIFGDWNVQKQLNLVTNQCSWEWIWRENIWQFVILSFRHPTRHLICDVSLLS